MKKGWEYKKLGEVCDFISGFAFKSNKFTKSGEPIIRISDIHDGIVDDSNVVFFNKETYNVDLSKYIIKPNDILIAMSGGTTGKIGVNTNNRTYYLNQRVGLFREKSLLNHYFLYYFLQTKREESLKVAAGAAQPNLSTAQIKAFEIPVPSLSEQQRIVSYLDAAFAKIDAVAKNAEDSLNEAKALFQSALTKMMEPKEGWEEKKIRDIADVRSGYAFKSSEFKPNGKYQVLRIGNVKRGIILYHVAPVFMPDSLASDVVNKSILKKGDIIITQTGTKSKRDYGYTAIVDCDNLLLNQRVARLRVNKEANLTFLLFYTWTKYFRDQFFSNEGGMVGQGNVSLETIKQIKIIYPSIEEQVEIVSLLSNIYHKIELLESNLTHTLSECAALKQSILRQTFE